MDRSNILTGGSTTYDITGLEEDSSYIINGIAFNEVSSTSHQITLMTLEAGEGDIASAGLYKSYLLLCIYVQLHLLLQVM